MLTKQRHEIILNLLDQRGSVSVTEAREILGASESTIRRDITALDREGKLVKVFGGAVAAEQNVHAQEYTVAQKLDLNRKEKEQIARYAASLIGENEFVFMDAGTTTACMLEHMRGRGATFVTNAVAHAQNLASFGENVILIGGTLKATTEAVIGAQAVELIRKYHFTKGFFGANGVSKTCGFTTPDPNEALVKRAALEQCRQSYMLCDYSKFDEISSVTFAPFYGMTLITDRKVQGYEECENVVIAS
jgi:DeoR family fructose operon transcriptional repressor